VSESERLKVLRAISKEERKFTRVGDTRDPLVIKLLLTPEDLTENELRDLVVFNRLCISGLLRHEIKRPFLEEK
jgi:hypothetical protein